MNDPIPLSAPDITDAEVQEVLGVLRTPWLSMGPKIDEFERRFAAFLGIAHAVAVANGTCGLHLAVRAIGVRPGAEVITTPFSFVASGNVLLFEGARPVFADVDPGTLNLTAEAVEEVIRGSYVQADRGLIHRETGAPLAGLLPVSVFGHPVAMDGFRALAQRYGLRIVLDACESFGSLYRSQLRGGWGSEALLADAAVYAFYPNKQLTTGEGGMIVSDDPAIASSCRMERNQGRRPDADWLDHDRLGFNYRMDELSAALGVAQLRRVEELLARRAQVARWYDEALADVEEIERPRAAAWARVSWFVYVVRVRPPLARQAVLDHLARRGIAAKAYFPPLHLFPHFRQLGYRPGQFPTAEAVAGRTMALPFFTGLRPEQVRRVATTLQEAIHAHAQV